jgi:hypothetical protein
MAKNADLSGYRRIVHLPCPSEIVLKGEVTQEHFESAFGNVDEALPRFRRTVDSILTSRLSAVASDLRIVPAKEYCSEDEGPKDRHYTETFLDEPTFSNPFDVAQVYSAKFPKTSDTSSMLRFSIGSIKFRAGYPHNRDGLLAKPSLSPNNDPYVEVHFAVVGLATREPKPVYGKVLSEERSSGFLIRLLSSENDWIKVAGDMADEYAAVIRKYGK